MRTPSSAATAAAAGVLPVLLLGTMDRNGAVRNSCYRTLLACVQHEQQRQEIVDVTVSSNNPVVRELLLQTFPGRRVEIEGGSTFLAVTYVLACAIAETHELRKTRQSLKESGCCLALPLQLLEKMAQVWCGGLQSLQCQSYGLALMCTLSDTDPILSGVECVQLLIYECMANAAEEGKPACARNYDGVNRHCSIPGLVADFTFQSASPTGSSQAADHNLLHRTWQGSCCMSIHT